MQFWTFSLAIAGILLPFQASGRHHPEPINDYGQHAQDCVCSTALGAQPVATLSTTYSFHYHTCTSTYSVIATETVTPPTFILYSTYSKTFTSVASLSIDIETVTSTSIFSSATATVSTSTVMVTASTTVTVSETTTIPAPAGFTPLQDSLPGATYNGDMGTSPAGKKRSLLQMEKRVRQEVLEYPQSVVCHRSRPNPGCDTSTEQATSTVYALGPTATIVATVSVTTTSTPVSESVTVKAVSTLAPDASAPAVPATTTTTLTSTSLTSVYAACATANFASNVGADFIDGIYTTSNNQMLQASDAYECCRAAFQPGSTAAIWFYNPDAGCYLSMIAPGSTCSAQSVHLSVATADGDYWPVTVGNGPCGMVNAVQD